jgi:hypothetical protein
MTTERSDEMADEGRLGRRSALKRMAVAGAVVWTAPVLTTALTASAGSAPPPPSPCGLPDGDPCLSQTVGCGANNGPYGCNSMQDVAKTACVCAQALVCDPAVNVVCTSDSDCVGGQVCAITCCTDADNNYLAICVTPC